MFNRYHTFPRRKDLYVIITTIKKRVAEKLEIDIE